MNDNLDWPAIENRMRAELTRAVLNERPRRVINVLISFTLGRQRTKLVLPALDSLCALVGISKKHMAEVFRECAGSMIVKFRRQKFGWEILIFPDSRQWQAGWYWDTAEMARYAAWIERVPGQAQSELFPSDVTVDQALAEVSAEWSSPQVGDSTPVAVPKLGTGVPKMGTRTDGGLGGRTLTSEPSSKLEPYRVQAQGLQALKKACNLEPVSTEGALVQRCGELFGADRMDNYGAVWRLRAREDSDKLRRVLDDTELAMREGRIKEHPAAYANFTWGIFK